MRIKLIIVYGVLITLTICCMACDKSKRNDMKVTQTCAEDVSYSTTDNGGFYSDVMLDEQETAQMIASQKLIKRVYLNLETLEYDKLITLLDEKIREYNGYVEESSSYGRGFDKGGMRSITMTARIPVEYLDTFVKIVGENTAVIGKRETSQDITSNYVDTESRKKALEIQQERLFALLEKAENMEDIITLESRISDVTYQLENYTSTLRTYDNQVEYSTVELNICEVERVTAKVSKNMWQEMKSGFSNTMYEIKDGLQSFAVWFVTNIPYLIFWIGAIVISFILIKKRVKKNSIGKSNNPILPDSDMNKEK